VDFDGDGLRDIWTSETDAIGSVANYFHVHGWRSGQSTVELVTLSPEADMVSLEALANSTLKPEQTVASLAALGLEVGDLDPQQSAALFRMALEDDAEYWLGLQNFYVITRYNRSRLYSLAVHQLAQLLLEARQAALSAQSVKVQQT